MWLGSVVVVLTVLTRSNSVVSLNTRNYPFYSSKLSHAHTRLYNNNNNLPADPLLESLQSEDFKMSSQVAYLNAQAAKLRAEAAELEAEEKKIMVGKLTEIFNAFDTNKDGQISLQELKEGLTKTLKKTVNEEQAKAIMKKFDVSGDGNLQLEEFRDIESFRGQFEKLLYEEQKAVTAAEMEAKIAKAAADRAESIAALINNKPPSAVDRVLSIVPFLLPFLDVLPYARFIITDYNLDNNPVVALAGFMFALYQTIPFAGLIAFFLFNILSTNLKLNRLVRYNIQLAIFLDISLIFPGIIGSISTAIAQSAGTPIPEVISTSSSNFTFVLYSITIVYAMISSLAGQEPDKVPFITERIKQRVPTTQEFQKMFEDYESAMNGELKRMKEDEERKQKEDEDQKKKK